MKPGQRRRMTVGTSATGQTSWLVREMSVIRWRVGRLKPANPADHPKGTWSLIREICAIRWRVGRLKPANPANHAKGAW
jgi:hypothetical protein